MSKNSKHSLMGGGKEGTGLPTEHFRDGHFRTLDKSFFSLDETDLRQIQMDSKRSKSRLEGILRRSILKIFEEACRRQGLAETYWGWQPSAQREVKKLGSALAR